MSPVAPFSPVPAIVAVVRASRRPVALALSATLIAMWLVVAPGALSASAAVNETEYRNAIIAANTLCDGGPHIIEITGNFDMSLDGDPVYSCADDLIIRGSDGFVRTITAIGDADRFLDSSGSTGELTIELLALSSFETFDPTLARGGAIVHGGDVVTSNAQFENNVAQATAAGGEALGGALFAAGDITVTSTTIVQGNTALAEGDAGFARGGAVYAGGDVTIQGGSAFSDNTAAAIGADGGAFGGAVFFTTGGSIDSGSFDSNVADGTQIGAGGAIYGIGGTFTVQTASLSDNYAMGATQASGGAIFNGGGLQIQDSFFELNVAVSSNAAARGGAVGSGAEVSSLNTIFVVNSAQSDDGTAIGGAVFAGSNVFSVADMYILNSADAASVTIAAAFGGAVFADGDFNTVSSLFYLNEANAIGDGTAVARGGAIVSVGVASIDNSTVTENGAYGTGPVIDVMGGGVYATTVELEYATLSTNEAVAGAQVTADVLSSFASVFDSAVDGNNCFLQVFPVATSYNFDDDGSCGLGDATDFGLGMDANLSAVAPLGTGTPSMMPLYGSPLIDVIPAADCVLVLDQRGETRPQGTHCDVGAHEVLAPVTFDVVTDNGVIHGSIHQATGVNGVHWTATGDIVEETPAGIALPFGIFGFTTQVPLDGWHVVVVLDLPAPVSHFYKIDSGVWSEYAADINGTQIVYTLHDGGAGDSDGSANGVIVDPVGLGVLAAFTG